MTPMRQTLALLRDEGWKIEITEHWNAFSRQRKDLFGIFDAVAVRYKTNNPREAEMIGVQTTSMTNVSARMKKLTDSDWLPFLRAANWTIEVHGWEKKVKSGKAVWRLRREDLS